MKQTFLNDRMGGADRTVAVGPNARPILNVALVYADAQTRQTAEHALSQFGDLTADQPIRRTECSIANLAEIGAFSEGVANLARADVIVVSLYEADRLPAPFYLWVNLWLQVRSSRPGTLLALVAPSQNITFGTQETRRYLYAAARQGGLDLVECDQPGEPVRGLPDRSLQWAKAA